MKLLRKTLTIAVICLVLSAFFGSLAYAQDPRPPVGGNGGDSGNGNGGSGGSSQDQAGCTAVKGQVLSWGVGPFGGVGVVLKTGSWQVDATSASDGSFGFGGLGVGIARLQVNLAPGDVGQLQPLVQDAALYLTCDHPVIANLAVYSGPRPTPPASIELAAPQNLTPGQDTVIRITVKNNLPTDISNVIITNLMPSGLTATKAVAATNSNSTVQIIDGGVEGQLVSAYLERMLPGTEENFLVTVAVSPEVAKGSTIKNTASLFYAESAGDQDWLDFTVGAGELLVPAAETVITPTVAAATATATPAPTATITPTTVATATVAADEGEDFVPPVVMPKTGDEFFPPPSLLPETGTTLLAIPATLPATGAADWLPLLGFGLGGAAFTLHQFRTYWRNRR